MFVRQPRDFRRFGSSKTESKKPTYRLISATHRFGVLTVPYKKTRVTHRQSLWRCLETNHKHKKAQTHDRASSDSRARPISFLVFTHTVAVFVRRRRAAHRSIASSLSLFRSFIPFLLSPAFSLARTHLRAFLSLSLSCLLFPLFLSSYSSSLSRSRRRRFFLLATSAFRRICEPEPRDDTQLPTDDRGRCSPRPLRRGGSFLPSKFGCGRFNF